MVVMPIQISETEYVLVVGVPPEGLARIRNYDPACLPMQSLEHYWQNLTLKEIQIGCATIDDINAIQSLIGQERLLDAAKVMVRNWAFRPDLGDHDGPMQALDGAPLVKPPPRH